MPANIQAVAGGPSLPANSNEYSIGVDTTTNSLKILDSTGANQWNIAAKGGVQLAEVTIPAASVALLRATPYTLVAAPGAGFMNVFHQAYLILKYVAPGFTETADNLIINWGTSSPTSASETIEATGFIDQTADTITVAVPDGGAATALGAATKFANLPLVLFNSGDGEYAGSGGSSLRVKLFYSVVPTS